jgi:hypothetical protein
MSPDSRSNVSTAKTLCYKLEGFRTGKRQRDCHKISARRSILQRRRRFGVDGRRRNSVSRHDRTNRRRLGNRHRPAFITGCRETTVKSRLQLDSLRFHFYHQMRACGAVAQFGRAPRSQCGGQGFDPPLLHQSNHTVYKLPQMAAFLFCGTRS